MNVRRSSRDPDERAMQPVFRSPYRCRDCGTKFWAIGTKAYRRIILLVVVNIVLFALIFGFWGLFGT
jgi:hypothetical protein